VSRTFGPCSRRRATSCSRAPPASRSGSGTARKYRTVFPPPRVARAETCPRTCHLSSLRHLHLLLITLHSASSSSLLQAFTHTFPRTHQCCILIRSQISSYRILPCRSHRTLESSSCTYVKVDGRHAARRRARCRRRRAHRHHCRQASPQALPSRTSAAHSELEPPLLADRPEIVSGNDNKRAPTSTARCHAPLLRAFFS
jgi:hypothetical protein